MIFQTCFERNEFMVCSHILGFPRMGAQRELKSALETYWKSVSEPDDTNPDLEKLVEMGKQLRAAHWALQKKAGQDWVTVGDFAYYDHVLNHIQLLGCEPARFGFKKDTPELERYFAMARGSLTVESGQAMSMTKWFDTNYHYIVPEFFPETCFALSSERLFDEVKEAKALGYPVKAVLLGPVSFLYLGREKADGFDRLSLLPKLLPVYRQILSRLHAEGVEWIQIDEPVLGLDIEDKWLAAFQDVYQELSREPVKLLLTKYFSSLAGHIDTVCSLPVAGLHVDAIRGAEDLKEIATKWPADRILSVGVIDGRNIWKADLDKALAVLRSPGLAGRQNLWVAPSCSLLHVPFSLDAETKMDLRLKQCLAFAVEKLEEIHALKDALVKGDAAVADALESSRRTVELRKGDWVHNAQVAKRVDALGEGIDRRKSPFDVRQALQRKRFRLPAFPTTTIGSFPQTQKIRSARAAFKRGAMSEADYRQSMQDEIAYCIEQQEKLGLDVFVHGEPERNDMVEYFSEFLEGMAMTANGWVQSYGSRCVKPPVIYGDVSRPKAMTVEWTKFAQSLTDKPVKAMLTGPITILQWSFVRDDEKRSVVADQIALAIRDEVADLEKAGIGIIQIDEPGLREGLPLRRRNWREYLDWACRAFRIASSGVEDDTQIHTHMCYAEFNDIMSDIASLDADVITLEASRGDMTLLKGFKDFSYPNEIGPGVYDIHSPRVPSFAEMVGLLKQAARVIPADRLWVNPDCGLKTRQWKETYEALDNMVKSARLMRETVY